MDAATFSFVVDGRGLSTPADDTATRAAGFSDAYDAIKPAGKRKQPSSHIMREDAHLRGQKRRQLMANAADLRRNLALAAWMIRRHLDYVSRFNFEAATGDRGLDRDLAEFVEIQSRPVNMDRGRRLSREKFFRLAEARRVLDGDFGIVRLRSGQVQAIKADLIRDPSTDAIREGDEWESGVRIDTAGAHIEYSIHRRTPGGRGTEFARRIPAANFHLYGFFDDAPGDQVRGVSPFAAAVADLRDVYESIDYAKTKIKLAQLLGIAFKRGDGQGLESALPTATQKSIDAGEACDDELDEPRTIDWSHGLTSFDLDPDESIELIESKTPSTEFQQFIRVVIMVAMKALDIPYSFFDEKHTNFHGSRGAWLQYDRSCLDKRDDQIEMRRRWTLWQFQRGLADGLLLPPSGRTLADLRFRWVPKGFPWWKPSEEVVGSLKAIAGGLDNPIRVCHEFDRGDVFDNIDRTLEVMKYAHDRGIEMLGQPLRLSFEAEFPDQITVEQIEGASDD